MFLYDLARSVKRRAVAVIKANQAVYLSPTRRIDRVCPPKEGRYVAMTFDDGPSANIPFPRVTGKGLTEALLDILGEHSAKATFDIIGTTGGNYPDKAGKLGSFSWGGEKYDHYPDFELDDLAGAVSQPGLVRRMIREGHELSSHGYTHVLFGKMRLIYGKRAYFNNIKEVIDDLARLHTLISQKFDVDIKMSRPPHYVDKIPDGFTSYDAYRYMGYQYLGASFNGGGWVPTTGDYYRDVEDMVSPLRRALSDDPDSLSGQIIFQKDGCNMSKQTPVCSALSKQLDLLDEYGYKVVTVSELLEMSPFTDVHDGTGKKLLRQGCAAAYRDNTLRPMQPATVGEVMMMAADPKTLHERFKAKISDKDVENPLSKFGITPRHPYFEALVDCKTPDYLTKKITPALFSELMQNQGYSVKADCRHGETLLRRHVLEVLDEVLL